jgi:acetyl-CoA acetyltransferase
MVNVENACASGSSALHLAIALVEAGRYHCVLAVGVEKLFHEDRLRTTAALGTGMDVRRMPAGGASPMMELYADAARSRGCNRRLIEAMSAVAVKNRRGATRNSNAQFRVPLSATEVQDSRMVASPLTLLMCSPLSDGASAVIVRPASAAGSAAEGRRRVRVAALGSATGLAGTSVARRAAETVYRAANLGPADIDVWQMHDASSYAELAQYEQVGICPPNQGPEWALNGRTGVDGDSPVNTDGGLLSRGHPLGATGLAQIVELAAQLRGLAGWQVEGARTGLAINAGGWIGDDYATCNATLLEVA